MIAHAFRGPHSLYRRYQAVLESALAAIGFAIVVTTAVNSTGVYPYNWILVTGIAIALLGIRWPLLAYIVAVAVITYAIFTINLYLAVLFLAFSALGHRLFVHYLGATTLVMATPLLAEYHLHWLVPVLGGLWWGGATGAWVGGLAAIWGKIVAGMAGMDIDWLVVAGHAPAYQEIAARFQEANSLETLLLLVEPFANTSNVILYNLLQAAGWALTGGLVGTLAWRKWVKYHTPWAIMVVTAAGGLLMLITHIGLPYWLDEAVSDQTLLASQDVVGPLVSLIVVIVVGTTLYSLRESLDLPIAPKRKLKLIRQAKQSKQRQSFNFFKKPKQEDVSVSRSGDSSVPTRRPVRVPHQSELPEWEPPKNDSGLIMLEID